MIIADECHHIATFTFERVLKYSNAKYVYGLTATPTRKDGHHPIINMQCGAIRYRVDAKIEAEKRPFEHYIIPRFTGFRKPAHRGERWEYADMLGDIQKCESRNDLIIRDVIAAVEQGRNPIILSERKEHVDLLANRLSQSVKNVITMNGVIVKTKDSIHQKFAVIDQRIVWYGSINLLSYGCSEESIMRIESIDIAAELLEIV